MVSWTAEDLRQFKAKQDKEACPEHPYVAYFKNAAMKLRPSTDEEKLNKTEKAYLAYLRAHHFEWIGIQNITLKMADDTRYTPDFWTFDFNGVTAREVKGFWRDDAKVKIKVAARLFPWIEFVVVQKKGSGWTHTTVKP